MTIKELKSEIRKSLDNVPESVLEDVLARQENLKTS